jgi:DHA1 family inner membrane transport protein
MVALGDVSPNATRPNATQQAKQVEENMQVDRAEESSRPDEFDSGPRPNQRHFLLIIALCGVGLGMTASITVLYASSFGASPAMAGLTWSSMAISLLVVDVFGTAVVPRINGRAMLCFALTAYGIGGFLSAVAPTLGALIAARIVQGVGAAVFMGGALQLVVRFAEPGEAGKAIGTFNAACFAGISTGPLIGGGLAQLGTGQFGYRLAFAVSGFVCLAVAAATRLTLPSIPPIRRPRIGLPARAQARPGLRLWPPLFLGIFGEALRSGVEFTVVPLFGKEHLGLGTAMIGLGLSALALVDISTMRFGGMLADRLGRRVVLAGALGIGVVACAAAPWVTGPVAFLVWCAVLGVPVGAIWIVPAAMVVDVSVEAEPALASYRIAGDVGEAAGSTATGALVGSIGHVGTAVVLGGVFAVVGGWVAGLREAKVGGASTVTPVPPAGAGDLRSELEQVVPEVGEGVLAAGEAAAL